MNTPKLCKNLHQLLLLCACLSFFQTSSSQTITGVVTDTSGKPLAFAAIKLGDTKQGVISDLNGKFRLATIDHITISHIGYITKKITLKDSGQHISIELEPSENTLNEVVIASNSNKLRRILNTALANRSSNNPDKYDWYQCNVYYKTTMNMVLPLSKDSLVKKDSLVPAREKEIREKRVIGAKKDSVFIEFLKNQHMFMTETYSRRTWERPQKLQEEVIASRMAGFKKSLFTALITDVLPFHAYDEYITLNGRDFHNPLSSGMFQRFAFKIEDEMLQGKDTLWLISFTPKKDKEQLKGTLYIHSNRFAIAHIIAVSNDTTLRREMGIEQQYCYHDGKWFPQQLNYYLNWKNVMNSEMEMIMKGTSLVDSVNFNEDKSFRFDKAHTIKLNPGADELHDTAWQSLRPAALDKKEERTYVFMDSLGKKHNFDNYGRYMDKLVDGFFPIGAFDADVKRIYNYNIYENNRFGLGLQTNERISKHFIVGGWFGYGTGDKMWKYGAYTELYLNKERDFTLKLGYNNDLKDPGRLQIHKELDKNFLKAFLIGRADNIQGYSIALKKRMGYWENTLSYTDENIFPKYAYTFEDKGTFVKNIHANEISLGFRYAYAERMAPLFGRYYSLGSKYPILYGKITAGDITTTDTKYIQAIAAVSWRKHINKIGDEKFLFIAAKNISSKPLPLSKLFAGNGFLNEDRAVYTFGGMQTMLPYQYYSNQFLNFYWAHDFDFKFFNKKISRGLSSAPSLSLGYNVLWGSLKNISVHKLVNFSVPNPPYHEGGLLINRLLRLKFMGLYYFNFNAGYFYHLGGPFNHKQNGKFVFGLSADL
jgi:hypothetical protein